MARIDDLIAQTTDKALRQKLQDALADMRRRQRFGLVFEEHVPETTTLLQFPIQIGAAVQRRDDFEGRQIYLVKGLKGKSARVEPEGGGPGTTMALADIMVVKRFGDHIFPALTPVDIVRGGGADKPHHAVINGENFHTLQLLVYLYEARVDCIYIDPPYNTGARDWKYNNRYVDENDAWRHSKWLSFMEKRLKLGKRLLKPDGVLIVSIDEHEVHHLGMLLERVFPAHLRYTVTVVINPKGTFKQNFGRVDEQLLFVVPNREQDVIVPRPVESGEDGSGDLAGAQGLIRKLAELAKVDPSFGDRLGPEEQEIFEEALEADAGEDDGEQGGEEDEQVGASAEYEDWFLRRRGQESSYRHQRPNQFFAIHLDVDELAVVGVGPLLSKDAPYKVSKKGSVLTVYPIDNEGHERVWRYSRETMQRYIDAGEIVVGKFNKKMKTWTLNHRKLKKDVRRLKTVWWEKRHDAGVHGTNVVNKLLGKRNLFPFPKSVYAVQDALASVVRNRPDALILDFFAGSGTTFHATCLLNAMDNGRRRCVLVTNNEVEEKLVGQLHKNGIYRGDPEFEKFGIFSLVTKPRCEAVVTGTRPDGEKVAGKHIDGRPFADGFKENVEFFRVDYLDPDEIDLGTQFEAIFPSLWLAAGGIGLRGKVAKNVDMLVPQKAPYAVLFREERFKQFSKALEGRADIAHVWLVTDSEDAFAEMRAALPNRISASMLYRDYLRTFRINTRQNL
jgi:adenine-specific DNA-methyltransferase